MTLGPSGRGTLTYQRMADMDESDSRPPVDWTYGLACLLGVVVFLVGPWVWYATMWLGGGPGDQLDGAPPAERAMVDGLTFMFTLFVTWLFVTWRVRVRVRRGRRVDGGWALVILGALELVAMVGVLVLFSP